MKYDITTGFVPAACKIAVYGPEGIGKSTFASEFPRPLFIDTEGSTKRLGVSRMPCPTSWAMLLDEIDAVIAEPTVCDTLVIDTIDWAEQLCIEAVCKKAGKSGIEDFGYGNGYVYEKEEFARFLHKLEDLVAKNVNVVLVAHAHLRKIEQPEEAGTYDHWEMKLGKKTASQIAPLVKEWADMVLFANYKTTVYQTDKNGQKHKAQGGKRVLYTSHTPWWDAKNRYFFPEEMEFHFLSIEPALIPREQLENNTGNDVIVGHLTSVLERCDEGYKKNAADSAVPVTAPVATSVAAPSSLDVLDETLAVSPETPSSAEKPFVASKHIPKALQDLMTADGISEYEVRHAVAASGYFPEETPIDMYDADFINGALVANWPSFLEYIKQLIDTDEFPFN